MIDLTVDTPSQTGVSEVVATAAVNNSNINVKGGEADGEGKLWVELLQERLRRKLVGVHVQVPVVNNG